MITKLFKMLFIIYIGTVISASLINAYQEIEKGLKKVEVASTTTASVTEIEAEELSASQSYDDLSEIDEIIKPYDYDNEHEIELAIKNIETMSHAAQKISKAGLISLEENEDFYKEFIRNIDDLTKLIMKSDNVYKFIKANGIIRVLSNNLTNVHSKLRTKLLLLLKELFNAAPTTADKVMPHNILDRLLDIFEKDNNLAIKAHALDIMHKWLPKNPQIQVRVMKTKGLETFYNQLHKLNMGVIHTLMDLFNKILKEHLDARNDKVQVTKDDGEKLVMYQRIGLLERMSTSNVCDGLLNIFQMLWSYNNHDNENLKIVFELIKNVKPFCSKAYQKKTKAVDFFKNMLVYAKNEDKKAYFEKHDVNVTDFLMVIEGYLDMEKESVVKDEF